MSLEPLLEGDRALLYLGDSADLDLEPCSIDALVTDPPAGISFMGKDWDGDKGGRDEWIAWLGTVLARAFIALKPGAHALVWALPRTSHWTALAVERAGFEIRDVVLHLFGSGFPKSLDVSKAIDARLGGEREPDQYSGPNFANAVYGSGMGGGETIARAAAATPEGAQWDGWGTALKPAAEYWILARKPLGGTVAETVLRYGTGGINIAGCRIGDEGGGGTCSNRAPDGRCLGHGNAALGSTVHAPAGDGGDLGRWPAHVVLDEAAAAALDAQSGVRTSGVFARRKTRYRGDDGTRFIGVPDDFEITGSRGGDSGGASRFFYVAKAPRSEKDQGLDHLPVVDAHEVTGRDAASAGQSHARAGMHGARRNVHPTVKSVALMRWLVRLVTPPGGVVLDMFAGSGTTGVAALAEGFSFVGVERDATYAEIARGRLAHALEACGEDVEPAPPRRAPARSSGPLFDWAQATEVKP